MMHIAILLHFKHNLPVMTAVTFKLWANKFLFPQRYSNRDDDNDDDDDDDDDDD